MVKLKYAPLNTRVIVFETSAGQHPDGVPGVIAAEQTSLVKGVLCHRVWIEDPSRVEWVPFNKLRLPT